MWKINYANKVLITWKRRKLYDAWWARMKTIVHNSHVIMYIWGDEPHLFVLIIFLLC